MNPEIVGYIAAILTTVAYIPQLIKVVRHRHTQSISLGMYSILTCGIFAWFVFGLLIGSPSVMLANGLTFIMAGIILFYKIKLG
ncbi:MAG: SemiSWEET transporter [Rickettsiales bacterium]|nr:SemiSWEET transporter [Rickettsiales bacterium]